MVVSQSTPTYSHPSKVLYFGTGYGWLWAYHTEEEWFRPVELGLGCPVVGSPLVIHDQGLDIVVVADRPNYPEEAANPSGRPLCPRNHGRVWAIVGLNDQTGTVHRQSYEAPTTKDSAAGFGGFITPSAIPAPDLKGDPSFVIGADGFEGGRAIRLALDRPSGYRLYSDWTVDGSAGFAGNLTSDGTNAYWLDTRGHIWAANLELGKEATSWPAYSINLPALIGARYAFTNTEPAVEVRDGQTHLYITLRNYTDHPSGADLRAGATGSDGAVVALGPGGELKWYRRFGPAERLGGEKATLNTAPLALISRGALIFGDVNGHIYSYSLDSDTTTGGTTRPVFVHPGKLLPPSDRHFLLREGELPARGQFTFSQVSGVGVDPAFAHGLLLVGVNYVEESNDGKKETQKENEEDPEDRTGRLVAYRAGEGYDLRWLDPSPEPLSLKTDQPIPLEGQVQLDLTTKPLSHLCQGVPTIQWYLTDSAGQLVRPLGEVPLPADLQPNQPIPIALDASLKASDPAEGQILGIIDLPSVYALGKDKLASDLLRQARTIAEAKGLTQRTACGGAAAEVVNREGFPGPESGLANNILRVDYTRQTVVDDPFVADLLVPPNMDEGQQFQVGIYLGYQNNLGLDAKQVQFRLWARPGPGSPIPEGGWQTLTIDQVPCCTVKTGAFGGLAEGTWEVAAELWYPGDTNPNNNRVVRTVVVRRPQGSQGSGVEGGAITD